MQMMRSDAKFMLISAQHDVYLHFTSHNFIEGNEEQSGFIWFFVIFVSFFVDFQLLDKAKFKIEVIF